MNPRDPLMGLKEFFISSQEPRLFGQVRGRRLPSVPHGVNFFYHEMSHLPPPTVFTSFVLGSSSEACDTSQKLERPQRIRLYHQFHLDTAGFSLFCFLLLSRGLELNFLVMNVQYESLITDTYITDIGYNGYIFQSQSSEIMENWIAYTGYRS